MRKRINQTIKLDDVARKAGVSPSTVSLYIRKQSKVSQKTATKIQHSIDELGYVHNKIASQFTGGKSKTIAIIVPSISNAVISNILQEIEIQISPYGFHLKIASHDHNLQKEEDQIRSMLEWSPATLVVTGSDHTVNTLKMLEKSSIPVIQILELGGNIKVQIGFDHFKAGYDITRYLHESGCKKIAFFTTRLKDDLRAKKRCESYQTALIELGIEQKPIIIDIPQHHNIYDTSRKYLSQVLVNERGIDGIIATNDAIGIGLLMEANQNGIAVPSRLSIIGFGDFAISSCLTPTSLSSVNLHSEQIAKEVSKLAMADCDNGLDNCIINTGYSIIPRQSTKLVI